MLKVAHISDLHLFSSAFELADFFSKRMLGQLNYLLKRKKHFKGEQLFKLKELFEQEQVEYVLVSGDLSCSSLEAEFKLGRVLFHEMEKIGIKCFFVPGNHDHYTLDAQRKKLFYQYYENQAQNKLFSLKNHGAEAFLLKENIWYIGLDTALPTGLLSSHGIFSHIEEKTLQEIFRKIPQNDKIILVNHFPFLDVTSYRKTLKRRKVLMSMLEQQKNVLFYLNGHTHKHAIEDLRKDNLPIVLDAGSSALNAVGRLNLIELKKNQAQIKVFAFRNQWKQIKNKTFILPD